MTRFAILLALAVPLAAGCSKSKTDKACKHMIDLATKELDKQIVEIDRLDKDGSMKKMMVGLKEKAEAQTSSDLATCAAKMEEHDIDESCILDADTLDEAQSCLVKKR
jgi:hypothetical protein